MNATIAAATNVSNPAPQGAEQSSWFLPLKRLKCTLVERLKLPRERTYHTGHYDARNWLIFAIVIAIFTIIVSPIALYFKVEVGVALVTIGVTGTAFCVRTHMDLWEKTEAIRTLFRTDIISLLILLEDYLENYHVDHLPALSFDLSLSSFLPKSGKENYFAVFDNNASLMSSLNDEAAVRITEFYRHMKAGREASDICVERWQRLTGLSQFGIVVYPLLPEYILWQDLHHVVTILEQAINLGEEALAQLDEPGNKALTLDQVNKLKKIKKAIEEVKVMANDRCAKYDQVQEDLFQYHKQILPVIHQQIDTLLPVIHQWLDMWGQVFKMTKR